MDAAGIEDLTDVQNALRNGAMKVRFFQPFSLVPVLPFLPLISPPFDGTDSFLSP